MSKKIDGAHQQINTTTSATMEQLALCLSLQDEIKLLVAKIQENGIDVQRFRGDNGPRKPLTNWKFEQSH